MNDNFLIPHNLLAAGSFICTVFMLLTYFGKTQDMSNFSAARRAAMKKFALIGAIGSLIGGIIAFLNP